QQTSITSNDFTYTSAKALPDTYKAGGKTYKFKGWYKGTDQTALKTTKTPSYAVTYDDQDDMTAVYEDLGETTTLPAQTFKFSFVDEQGNLVNPSGISLKGNLQEYVSDETPKIIGEIIGKDNGMVKEYTIPEKVFYGVTDTRFSFYGAKRSIFTLPKYYKSLTKNPGTYYSKTAKVYPAASIRRKNFITGVLETEIPNDLTYRDLFTMADPTQFSLAEARYNVSPTNTTFTALGMAFMRPAEGIVVISKDDSPIYYYLENRRVTENFVDATGAKITPPTGFTQGNKVVIDSENFTYTSAKALPDTYTVGDKNYKFKGWYKGTDQTKMETTKTPSYAVTYDDKDDMTAVYEEVQEITVHPGFYAEFVDEQGKAFTNPLTLSGNYTEFFRKTATSPFEATFGFDGTSDYKQTINYKVTRKQVTENFVDATGAKITPPTGFTQGKQTPMTSNSFKYTAARALPASYSAGGKAYTFQGWYKGKTKPNTLTTSTTPTYNTTFDGNDDMTAVYKEEVAKASVTLTRTTAETVTSGGNVTWRATITNTSQAPLTTATIKKSTAWTTGLAAPTAMIVTPVGGTAKTVPVTATTWTNGVSLGTDIPVGKSATVQFTTKATGTAGQVLRAGITTSGNYSGISASATVRVKDNDQAIVTPTAEGFISVPTFNFGQIGIAGNTQQHGLKKAADYYGNGTRNPYLRIKKTQPNWSLTAQLSQPKSATDSLPTATRLLLGTAPVSSFSNYNQPTELKNTIGTTTAINLTANNTATNIVANQQFTGSNVYQLDFTFDNIKLEVPASQGMTGQQYQAAVTWNLVTGP
uniref:WxL domain-containing protein n=3 Tax=Enterococcus faecalis TaxID=1351 RepID=UPI001CD649F7